jgi:class 3 adenylate cyclase
MATVIPTTTGTGAPRERHRRVAAMALMSRPTRATFVSILVASALISLICVFASGTWIGRPFAGVTINERLVVANIGRLSWTGLEGGFKYPDKIIAVDDRPVHSMKELNEIILRGPIGEAHTYLVERGDSRFRLTIPTMRFTWVDLFLTFGLMLIAGLMYLSMGIAVFLLKPAARASWAFLFVAFSLSVYSITAFDVVTTLLGFNRLHLTALACFGAALTHLGLVFPEQHRIVERFPSVQLVPYLVAALLIIPLHVLYPAPGFVVFHRLIMVYVVVGAIALFASAAHAYFRSSPLARQRAKVVVFGAGLALPAPSTAHAISLFGGAAIPPNYIAIPLVVLPAAVAYAIARHNLFEADVYIKRTVGYGAMTAVVGVAYFATQTLISRATRPVLGQQADTVYPIVFAALIVFLFNPVSRKVQQMVDRLFFRGGSDYKQTISVVSNALTSMLNLDQILKQVVGTVRTAMFVDASGVIVLDHETRTCRTFFAADQLGSNEEAAPVALSYDDPLLEVIRERKTLVTRYDVEEEPSYLAVKEACLTRFNELGATVAIPLLYQGTVTGVLAVGEKKSGHFYAREDIELLSTMANQAAVAIQNASAHERVVRYAAELEASLKRIQLLESIKSNLSKFVPRTVQELIEESPQAPLFDKRELDVSVLFADITGYTRLSAEMELERVNELVERYFGAFLDEIMKYGGDVNETAGDGLMVIFKGADHARAAALTALAILRRTREINAELRDRLTPIAMKVGVNSGIASVGATKIEGAAGTRWTYTASGPTTNIAARLAALTEGGAVIVSEATKARIGDDFEAEDLGPQSLKNVPDPVRAYRLTSRSAEVVDQPASSTA